MVGLSNGNTIFQKVAQRVQPSMNAASSSSSGILVCIAPWNMKVAMDTEKPVCSSISVTLWLSTPSMPPYTDTNGTISTWKGMTMDAIMAENSSVHAIHLLRTRTKPAIAEKSMVRTVEQRVITSELANTFQKSIFLMASGKLDTVKPCLPISDSGWEVMSALVLNTLMTTNRNGAMNMRNSSTSTTSMMACIIVFLRRAFSESVIMPTPPLSYRHRPG